MGLLPVRRTVRASGFAALAAVVLFAVVGLWAVTAEDGPGRPLAVTVVRAGEPLDISSRSRAVVWGAGARLAPDDVTCSVTKRDGRTEQIDVAALDDRSTAEPLSRGARPPAVPDQMVQLAEVRHLVGTELTCSGGGLETFALGEVRLGPPKWVVGVGFFVLAGVAALWAAATLATTRPAPRRD